MSRQPSPREYRVSHRQRRSGELTIRHYQLRWPALARVRRLRGYGFRVTIEERVVGKWADVSRDATLDGRCPECDQCTTLLHGKAVVRRASTCPAGDDRLAELERNERSS